MIIKSEEEVNFNDSFNEMALYPNCILSEDRRQSFDSTSSALHNTSNVVTSTECKPNTTEEQFGLYVAQRLSGLPDILSKRKTEIEIQEAIVKAEKGAFQ